MVAPKPPRSGGASAKAATRGWSASSDRTIRRWTPTPRPWISRTCVKPRAWAASRYSATTDGMSRGANACRSSASSIGIRPARRLQPRPSRHVLLPVVEAQEILPRELALSEGRRALEEGHVHQEDILGTRGFGDLLAHHLTHERDRDPAEPMDDLLSAADPRAGEHRPLGHHSVRLALGVRARLGHELLEAERHVV